MSVQCECVYFEILFVFRLWGISTKTAVQLSDRLALAGNNRSSIKGPPETQRTARQYDTKEVEAGYEMMPHKADNLQSIWWPIEKSSVGLLQMMM